MRVLRIELVPSVVEPGDGDFDLDEIMLWVAGKDVSLSVDDLEPIAVTVRSVTWEREGEPRRVTLTAETDGVQVGVDGFRDLTAVPLRDVRIVRGGVGSSGPGEDGVPVSPPVLIYSTEGCRCHCAGNCPSYTTWKQMDHCPRPAKYLVEFDRAVFPISSPSRMCDECVAMRRAEPKRWPILSIRSIKEEVSDG